MSFNRHAPPYRTEWQPRRYPGEPPEHDPRALVKRTIEERLEALRLRRQLDGSFGPTTETPDGEGDASPLTETLDESL